MAVEEILAGIDIKRGPGLGMQGTESDELGAVTARPTGPILLPQVVEQWKSLFEFFDILAHGAVLPPETNVEESRQHSQARMVGDEKISQRRRGQRICRTGVSSDKARLRDRPDPRALTSGPDG